MAIIWGIYLLSCIGSVAIFYSLSKTREFKYLANIAKKAKEEKLEENVSIWESYQTVREESTEIILAYALQMLIFPAIFYNLTVRRNIF